jgi:hypothetical protein
VLGGYVHHGHKIWTPLIKLVRARYAYSTFTSIMYVSCIFQLPSHDCALAFAQVSRVLLFVFIIEGTGARTSSPSSASEPNKLPLANRESIHGLGLPTEVQQKPIIPASVTQGESSTKKTQKGRARAPVRVAIP